MASDKAIKIIWDHGTAYDFLASLHVLHFPDEFGLRGAWAAGVRSRLPGEAKEFLEAVINNFNVPLHWVYSLPAPKDSATALLALKSMPAADRLPALHLCPMNTSAGYDLMLETMERRSWDQKTLNDLVHIWRSHPTGQTVAPGQISAQRAETVLNLYADPEAFGEKFLYSLHAYYEVFFSEEERRIVPKLEQTLEKAQSQADKLGMDAYLDSLMEKMDNSLRIEGETLILVPSYWCAPGLLYNNLKANRMLLLFGARPKEESLVPGEIVPEDLLLRLKALTDPTRMRILRYLLQEQLTPAELARRLRLRAPTVTHHLHSLKAAGMVEFVRKGKNEHLYYAKMESVKELYVMLKDFLEQDVNLVEGFDLFSNDLL